MGQERNGLERVLYTDRSHPMQRVGNRYAGMKVVGLTADVGACGYYRVINPLHMLYQHGADVDYSSVQNIQNLVEADLIVAPRQNSEEVYENLRRLQWEGKRVFYEIDDNLHTVLPTSPAYQIYHPGAKVLDWVGRFMQGMHGVTTTTPEIARAYSRYNTNIAVIENFIDYSYRDWGVDVVWSMGQPLFKPRPLVRPKEFEGYITIAWQGGSTHLPDLKVLLPSIKTVLEKYPKTMFVFYGAWNLFDAANQEVGIPEDRVFKVEPRHFMDHPEALRGFDIGLAPLFPCEFNVSKSSLKILEGIATGQAMVASNVGPYARFEKRHPGSVLLVGNGARCHATWVEAISRLVEDEQLRRDMQESGRRLAVDRYSLERNFHLWPLAWGALSERAMRGEAGPPEKQRPLKEYLTFGTAGRNDPCPCGSGVKLKKCCAGAWGSA